MNSVYLGQEYFKLLHEFQGQIGAGSIQQVLWFDLYRLKNGLASTIFNLSEAVIPDLLSNTPRFFFDREDTTSIYHFLEHDHV